MNMNKIKFNKLIVLLPALILTGCGKDGGTSVSFNYTSTSDVYKVKRPTTHINAYDIGKTSNVFYQDGKINYKLVYGDSTDIDNKKIIAYFRDAIYECLGQTILIEEEPVYTKDSKYIVFNNENLVNQAGVEKSDKISKANKGYSITTKDNSIFVQSKINEGYRLAAKKVLEELIGFDVLRSNHYVFDINGKEINKASTVYVPNFNNFVEVPDYSIRYISHNTHGDPDATYQMGFSEREEIKHPADTTDHNSFSYVPQNIYTDPSKYRTLPFYADLKEKNGGKDLDLAKIIYSTQLDPASWFNKTDCQLCFTVHGNKLVYDWLMNMITDQMIELIYQPENLNHRIIRFCQMDDAGWCACPSCREVRDEYGSASSTLIMFINNLSRTLQAKLEEEAIKRNEEKRDIIIQTFIYSTSFGAPTKRDSNMILDDNVGVILCPSSMSYIHSIFDEKNTRHREDIEFWSSACKNIASWLYTINYSAYLYPYNNYGTILESYRYMYDCNAVEAINEGHGAYYLSHFTNFENYIDSHALIDLKKDFVDYEEKYFRLAYGDGGEAMHQFFVEMRARLDYLTETGVFQSGTFSEEYYNKGEKIWTVGQLKHFADLIDIAYTKIEPLKYSNPSKYEKILYNIQLDAIFPHAALTIEKDEYLTEAERQKYRKLLVDECTNCDTYEYFQNASNEGNTLKNLFFDVWGY